MKGYGKKGISPRCMLKLDMQKAYDSIECVFVEQMLKHLNFPGKFIRWVMECLTTFSYSICINGWPSEPFYAKWGLRQWDPMSPFLFVLAMDYLSRMLKKLMANPNFKFHPRCVKMKVIQLGFTDDFLLFCKGEIQSVQLLYKCFHNFS